MSKKRKETIMGNKQRTYNVIVVAAAILIVVVHGSDGIVTSDVEKQLEKVGTRVGKNEYISIFKEPPGTDGEKSKTFVLLSKLYLLGPNVDGDLNEVINYPGGPLKFRRQYIIPSKPAPTTTTTSTTVAPVIQTYNEKILFPREDTTTRKTPHYNVYNMKKTISTTDSFPERKYVNGGVMRDEVPETVQPPQQQFPEVPLPLMRYLSRLEEGKVEGNLNPLLPDPLSGGGQGEGQGTKEGETLGYYTLITVPRGKKPSDCPQGQRKDHHGICREVFVFGGGSRRSSSSSSSG